MIGLYVWRYLPFDFFVSFASQCIRDTILETGFEFDLRTTDYI